MQQIAIPGFEIVEPVQLTGSSKAFIGLCEETRLKVWLKLIDLRTDTISPASAQQQSETFLQAGAAMVHLRHKNLARLCARGRSGESLYQASEYIFGASLDTKLQELCLLDKIYIVKQLAAALYYLGSKGATHLNLKPSNILLRERDSRVVLTDPGIPLEPAKLASWRCYASPELLQDNARADIRADLYSLGVIFYELLMGEVPFPECSSDTTALAQREIPPLTANLSLLQPIIDRLLASAPAQRFANGQEFIAALDALDDEQIVAIDAQAPMPLRAPGALSQNETDLLELAQAEACSKTVALEASASAVAHALEPATASALAVDAAMGEGLRSEALSSLEEISSSKATSPFEERSLFAATSSFRETPPFEPTLPPEAPAILATTDQPSPETDAHIPQAEDEAPLVALRAEAVSLPARQSATRHSARKRKAVSWNTPAWVWSAGLVGGLAIVGTIALWWPQQQKLYPIAELRQNGQALGQQTSAWFAAGGEGLAQALHDTRVWLAARIAPDQQPARPVTRAPLATASAGLMPATELASELYYGALLPARPAGVAAADSLAREVLGSWQPEALQEAMALIDRYAATLLTRAEENAARGAYDEAMEQVRQALLLKPGDPHLQRLEAELQRQLESQQQISALTARAEVRRRAGDILYPADDNAVLLFKQVLALNPADTHAQAALTEIKNNALAQAEQLLDQGRLNAADELLLRVNVFFGSDSRAMLLGTRLDRLRETQRGNSALANSNS